MLLFESSKQKFLKIPPPLQIQNVRYNVTKTELSKRFFNAVTKPAAKPYPTKWGRYMDQITS